MPAWTTELLGPDAAEPATCLSDEEMEARLDLSELVTVFLLTSGEPSTDKCRQRILHQSVKVRLEEISGVTPMWRAFQEMHRAETPFFVQVDADMLLHPTAVADLLAAIQEGGEKTAIYCAWLWGDAEDRAITGVKIYRTAVVTRYPYTDSVSCDQNQFEAIKRDGFETPCGSTPRTQEECAGLHFSLQTPAMAFRRWRRLMEKYRARPEHMGWLTPYPERMRKRMSDDPSPMNLAIYDGVVAGLSGPTAPDRELDASDPDPAIRRLNWLMGKASNGPQEMTLYMTSRCNHRCTWCRLQQEETDPAPDMTVALVTRALSLYPTIHSVCLAGFGEPLMHRDLEGIFRVLRDHDCHTAMVTNGVRLGHFAQQLADWGCGAVTVSLNAPDAKRHKGITQEDTWSLVMEGIRAAVPLLRTGISAVVTKNTVQDIPAFLRLALDLGVEHVHLHNLLPHGDPNDPGFLNEVVTTESEWTLGHIAKAKTLPGAELVGHWPVPIDLDHCPGICESPFTSIGIDGDGRISPCRRVAPPSDEYGRLHRSSWIGPAFSKMRSAMLRDRPLPAMCQRCFGAWYL